MYFIICNTLPLNSATKNFTFMSQKLKMSWCLATLLCFLKIFLNYLPGAPYHTIMLKIKLMNAMA